MRLNDERAQAARRRVEEARIRRIVREEIVAALGALARAADGLDVPYETAELDSRALGNIGKAAENTIRRLTCAHEYKSYNPGECARCGEPAPEPVNPFEPEVCEHAYDDSEGQPTGCIHCGSPYPGKARVCPVDPDACGSITGWEAFLAHIYEVHTEDGKGYDRNEVVQRLLEQGGHHG
jgi:hypothetical protein